MQDVVQIVSNLSVPSIAVLLTCFNRVRKTLACLEVVFQQAAESDLNLKVFLVDDGSTDDTAEAVATHYPQVHLLRGGGNLFWNRGMHLAFEEAIEKGFDYYLWLNDDTNLHSGAIRTLLDFHEQLTRQGKCESIIISSTKDPASGEFSYGGYERIRKPLFRLGLSLVKPSDRLQPCDTFCGNCVLIPKSVVNKVGNIDPVYLHRWGDVDYGLRATKKGVGVWVAPGYLADCEANPVADEWRNPELPISERIKGLHSLKGLGKQDWPEFLRRHGGSFWRVIWVKPYLRIIFDRFAAKSKAAISRILGQQ